MRPDLISYALSLACALVGGFLIAAGEYVWGAVALLILCAFVWDLTAQWHHDEQRAAEDEYMGKTH